MSAPGAAAPRTWHWADLPHAECAQRARQAAATPDPEGLSALLGTYLRSKGTRVQTHANYRARLPDVVLFLKTEHYDLLRPEPEVGERFLRFMVAQGASITVVRASARTFRAINAALTWVGLVHFDPFAGLDIQATTARLCRDAPLSPLAGAGPAGQPTADDCS